MKNFKLLSLVVLLSMAGPVFAKEYSSDLFKGISTFGQNFTKAVAAIFDGSFVDVLDKTEKIRESFIRNPRAAVIATLMDAANDGSARSEMSALRSQAIIIYVLGTLGFGSVGLYSLYKAYNTDDWEKVVSGTLGAVFTTAAVVAAYKAMQL